MDSLAAECARLRTELAQVRADALTTRRMTAPQRVLRLFALVTVVMVALGTLATRAIGASELRSCRISEQWWFEAATQDVQIVRAKDLEEIAEGRQARTTLEHDLESCRAEVRAADVCTDRGSCRCRLEVAPLRPAPRWTAP